jgi:hypothetical protein
MEAGAVRKSKSDIVLSTLALQNGKAKLASPPSGGFRCGVERIYNNIFYFASPNDTQYTKKLGNSSQR